MSSIEEEGFLSEEINQWIKKHRQENSELFKLCENLNRFSHSTMFTIHITTINPSNLLVSCLYIKAMSTFQGIILMTERGMVNEAKVLLRCLLECMFAIVAIGKDDSVADNLLSSDQIKRKKALKSYKENRDAGVYDSTSSLSKADVENLIKELEKEIKENGIKDLKIQELAQKAGLDLIYNTAYRILSASIHVDLADLHQYLKISDGGELEMLLWGPDANDINLILYSAAGAMLRIVPAVSVLFALSFDEAWIKIKYLYQNCEKLLKENDRLLSNAPGA